MDDQKPGLFYPSGAGAGGWPRDYADFFGPADWMLDIHPSTPRELALTGMTTAGNALAGLSSGGSNE